MQLSELGHHEEKMKMPKLRNGSKGDSNPGTLDCQSGILPFVSRFMVVPG